MFFFSLVALLAVLLDDADQLGEGSEPVGNRGFRSRAAPFRKIARIPSVATGEQIEVVLRHVERRRRRCHRGHRRRSGGGWLGTGCPGRLRGGRYDSGDEDVDWRIRWMGRRRREDNLTGFGFVGPELDEQEDCPCGDYGDDDEDEDYDGRLW